MGAHRLASVAAACLLLAVFTGLGLAFFLVLNHANTRDMTNEFHRLASIQANTVQSYLNGRGRVAMTAAVGLGNVDSIYNRKAMYEILAVAAGEQQILLSPASFCWLLQRGSVNVGAGHAEIPRDHGEFEDAFDRPGALYAHRFVNPGMRQELDMLRAMYDPKDTQNYSEYSVVVDAQGRARPTPFNASAVDEAMMPIHSSRLSHAVFVTADMAREAALFFNQFSNPPTRRLWTAAAIGNEVLAGSPRTSVSGKVNFFPVVAPVWQPSSRDEPGPYNVSLANWRGNLVKVVWNITLFEETDQSSLLWWRFVDPDTSFVVSESHNRQPVVALGHDDEPLRDAITVNLLRKPYTVIVQPTQEFVDDFTTATPLILLLTLFGVGVVAAGLTLWVARMLRQKRSERAKASQVRPGCHV